MVAIFADSNRARMRYIRTTAGWGTIPAAGSTREIRYTGSTIKASKQTTMSDEIRADRMVEDIIETSAKADGEINIEFSAGSHDDFLESFMYGTWTRPMTFDSVSGQTLSWAAGVLYVNGADVTPYFHQGRRIRTIGFATPANNDYFEIASISFNNAANRTEITPVAVGAAAAEAGTAYTAMYDANDVVVLKNTAIRFGTGGASTIDSNGSNAFTAAIAAGQLQTGQIIYVDGLGFDTGEVTIAAATTTPIAAGSQITVSDGTNVSVFQFGGVVPQTAVAVAIGANETAAAANLAAAINSQRVLGKLQASATSAAGVVTIRNLNQVGGAIANPVDTAGAFTVTAFSGGDTTLRGAFTIETATDDVLTVSPKPHTNANAGLVPVTIKASMLRNPSQTIDIIPQDYVIETGFEDVSQYFIANGQRVGAFSMDLSANAILKGNFTFSGQGMTNQQTSLLGSAPYVDLATTSTPVTNSTVNVGYIHLNGNKLSTAIQAISLSGDNSLRDQNAVGSKFPVGIGAGRMEIKGSLKAYFADSSLWNIFINHTTVSIAFDIQDVLGNAYYFTVPAVVFSTDNVNPAGINQDVMEDLEFMAKRDPATDCQIQIDRFSCVLPTTA